MAESILGSVDWQDSFAGFCRCPGADLHTHRTGKRDCQVLLDGAPTIYCFHTSCAGAVEQANHRLRSEIGKAERGGIVAPYKATPADIARRTERERAERMKAKAGASLRAILAAFQVSAPDLSSLSPTPLKDDPREHWRDHLALFDPADVVWAGNVYDSGEPKHAGNFRAVAEWLKGSTAPGNFTCGSVFKNNVHSRSNENVLLRRYLVIESDTLTRGEMLSIIAWCQQFMHLRAVVDTGGKSLHGWFTYPAESTIAELKVILPQLQCDPALFKPAQPCRLAGAWRADKSAFQRLLFLDLKA